MKMIADRLYENFSVDERLELTIAALARQDMVEVKKLRSTCEKKDYRMNDDVYEKPLESAHRIAISYMGLCTVACGEIDLVYERYVASQGFKKYYCQGVEWALKSCGEAVNQDEIETEGDLTINMLIRDIQDNKLLFEVAVGRLKSAHKAFVEVCAEKEVNHEHLIKWFEIDKATPLMNEYLSLMPGVDEGLYKIIKDGLVELWEK